ncbi:MAG: class I adenylate-forming enzyme family protein [Prevotella sp.]|nr:class I adenylate-forming enzyme family protein [Prevotella sp.]
MNSIENYLVGHAIQIGDKDAIVCKGKKISYYELYAYSKERANQFLKSGEKAIILKVSQDEEFIISYFGAHLAGLPIVPLEKDIPDYRMMEIHEIIKNSTIHKNISDILFTTGTTGKQKGVMISREAILANAENLIEAQEFTQELAFVICGPLNHIGSLSKIWPMIVVGGTIIITEGIKDTDSFFQSLELPYWKFGTFLVPASIRMLLKFEKDRLEAYSDRFDFIETGGAALMTNDMEELCRLFNNTRLYNTYASTETGIISTHDYRHNGCITGCVGHVMKHSEVFITENSLISCKGKTLMSGYVGDDSLTHSILKNGVLYTSDIGRFDSSNNLILYGRKGDVINIGGYKVMPTEVEDVASTYKGISDCICIGEPHPIMGNILRLIYSINKNTDFEKKAFIEYIKQNIESYKVPMIYEEVESIHRTFNGKLDRNYYCTKQT